MLAQQNVNFFSCLSSFPFSHTFAVSAEAHTCWLMLHAVHHSHCSNEPNAAKVLVLRHVTYRTQVDVRCYLPAPVKL